MSAKIIDMSRERASSDSATSERLVVSNLLEASRKMLEAHRCDAACVECVLLRKAIDLTEKYYLNRERT